jgi:serine/threonine protein kinase
MDDTSHPEDRFSRIEELYHQALKMPAEERPGFFARACAGEDDLRREVEKLLAFDRKAGSFMESPALDVAAHALAQKAGPGSKTSFTGQTILHYRVLEKIGEGGLGIVYKALDTHLQRHVAIKVLPPEIVADRERRLRFVQEARAASALNHPNIVHVYDIDQSASTDFIAMEYVTGKTLAELIPRKGMKLTDALKYSIQIADAVAAAHATGIVHRDLKPANVIVTETGLVKVLDFGLAKLSERREPDGSATTETTEPRTEEGTILGTVAYMSPEQAEGKKVDARSDIFSLGSVLYEMVTGQKAFQGTSKLSTLSALLHQEPKPVSGITPVVPAELERLINRCLRKDPAKRFQHMDDVKVALEELKEDTESGRLQAGPAAAKKAISVQLAVVIIAVIALVVAGWYWLSPQHPTEPAGPLASVPLTSYPGFETSPSFSPDGTQVAFQWCKDPGLPPKNCDIYIKQIGEEQPFPLTSGPAGDRSPAWSPDARYIAFLRQLSATKASIVLIPQRGGQERVVGESCVDTVSPLWRSYLAWTPDSNGLVFASAESAVPGLGLSLLSLETREKRKLTSPPEGTDTCPAVSPDGRTLAFTRMRGNEGDTYLLRLGENYEPQGAPKKLAEMGKPGSSAPAWMPDGGEILCVSGSWLGGGLCRAAASLSAKPRRMTVASEWVAGAAVSRQGNRPRVCADGVEDQHLACRFARTR